MISKPNLLGTEQETSSRQDASNHQPECGRSFRGSYCQSTAASQAINDVIAAMTRMEYCQDDIFAVHLALEEAIVNALKHGNQNDRTKQVRIDCEVAQPHVQARIEDEGGGFVPSQVPDPTAPENLERPSGRGLMLMRLYMTSVHFNRRGNCVTLCKNRTTE